MKILFFGSSDYCIPILKSLHSSGMLSAVITRPDRPIGRKQIMTSSPVKQFAQDNKIECFTPENKEALILLKEELSARQFDLAVVADFGMIIPKEVYEFPKYHTLNIHFSKLPFLRGASPVQFTIIMGEKTAWITLIVMDETMDTGDILWQQEIIQSANHQIIKLSNETTGSLYQKLFEVIAIKLPDIINDFLSGKLIPHKQDHSQATYTKRLTREDGFIPWEIVKAAMKGETATTPVIPNLVRDPKLASTSFIVQILKQFQDDKKSNVANFIERMLRAFSPWPGIWTEVEINKSPVKKRLKILKAHIDTSQKLILEKVQLEGKNPVSYTQLVKSFPLFGENS